MKKLILAILAIATLVIASSCAPSGPRVIEKTNRADNLIKFRIESPAIAAGKLEKKPEAEIFVSLPASYKTSGSRRYPVVYALHGFAEGAMSMILTLRTKATGAPGVPEVIIVSVEGGNSLGGSFYANSVATGNWEDLVAEEAVALVDARFRTIPTREGRALAGYSMGGFGSWAIALHRPDVFSGAWACCPGAWDENGIADTIPGWDATYRNAYGAAYAPDLALPPPYARIPKLDGSDGDAALVADWQKGFGSVDARLAAYAGQPCTLKLVSLAYGNRDGYGWIPRGTRHVADRMAKAGIPVAIKEYNAGHLVTDAMIAETYIPFLTTLFR